MLGQLKKLLAECHLSSTDRVIKILSDSEPRYLIQRAQEELIGAKDEPSFEEAERRLKMAIQLINLARYKLKCCHSNPSEQLKTGRKPKSSKPSSTN